MSKFSGKCDFCDTIETFGFDYIKNSKVYVDGKLLSLKTLKDCIPYYSYIVGSSFVNKESAVIHLSSYSWLQRERELYGIMRFHNRYRKMLNEELLTNGLPLKYSDEECLDGFFSKVNEIGNLFRDVSLFEDWKNDTFICSDNKNNKYLVRTLNKVKGIYVIASVSDSCLLDMIENKVSMEQTFRNSKGIYLTIYNIETDSLAVKKRSPLKIGKNYLPKPNLFLNEVTELDQATIISLISR